MTNIKQLILLSLFSLISSFSFAQEGENRLVKQSFINLLPISYNLEVPLSQNNSFMFEAGASTLFDASFSSATGYSAGITFVPFLEFQYRHYYKFKSDNKKGKPLFANSGNYIFGTLSGNSGAVFSTISIPPSVTIGGGWGIQRVYQNNFVFNFGLGVGYFSGGSFPVSLIGDLGLGILIGKNRQ